MPGARILSPSARQLLVVLAETGGGWRHGYELARATGIRSGTLYPLLMRLAERGFLEAEWQAPREPGRPARHVYRLTAAGRQLAADNPPVAASSSPKRRGTRFA